MPLRTERGITLIETLVAITLLSFVIGGPMALAMHSIKASSAIKNELVATHLAEEGLESLHSLRDNVSADDTSGIGTNWMTGGFFSDCSGAFGCIIDVMEHPMPSQPDIVWNTANATAPCPDSACAIATLYFNPNTGIYRQSTVALPAPWTRTLFRRTLFISGTDDPVTPERQVRMTVVVTYPGYGGITRTTTVTQDLYNWFPELP